MKITMNIDNLHAGGAPLYHQFAGQSRPQPAFVELDEAAVVLADYSVIIGSGVPESVWHGRTRRYWVSCYADGKQLAEWIEGEGRELLQRVHNGHKVIWDGNNYVGRLTDDARDAEDNIVAALRQFDDPSCQVQVWDAEEYLRPAGFDQVWPKHMTIDEAVEENELCASADGVTLSSDVRTVLLNWAAERDPDELSETQRAALVKS